MSEIFKELARIQQELKAPKGQYNNFGKYKYRNCEDILEAVKPLLGTCTLTISDDIQLIGDRFYVKATATLYHHSGVAVTASAYAREALAKKGMDDSQITGSASSYARKYALNGLFAIDDTKDADSQDNSKQQNANNKQTSAGRSDSLLSVLSDGNDFASAEYWRNLSPEQQEQQWRTLDKDSQKHLKSILQQTMVKQ